MQTYAIYLEPHNGASFVSEIHSDTIFGAICWAIRVLHGKQMLEEMLDNFNQSPKFAVSSAFPCLESGDAQVRFFPKPQIPGMSVDTINSIAEEKSGTNNRLCLKFKRDVVSIVRKVKDDVKKVAYLSGAVFSEVIRGQADSDNLYRRLEKKELQRIGSTLLTSEECRAIYPDGKPKAYADEADVQHNQIDRIVGSTLEGMLFYTKETFLHPNIAKLWFVLQTEDLDFLKPAFRYLQDTGIGGERTIGKGHFDITIDKTPFQLPEAEHPDSFVNLSRYLPADGEVDFRANALSYKLLILRPKHEFKFVEANQPVYKKLLRVFEVGSIFPLKERKKLYGGIVQVGDLAGRKVFHSGLTIPIFAKIQGGMK